MGNPMAVITDRVRTEVERQVQARTGRQIRDLSIEFGLERVVLRGRAASFYAKQLAQHGVRDVLPQVVLENAIIVEQE